MSQLKSSPLKLVGYEYLNIEVVSASGEVPDSDVPIRFEREWGHSSENTRIWKLALSIFFGSRCEEQAKSRYSGVVKVVGYFEVMASAPIEKMDLLVRVTGASILYAACREMVASLTSRYRFGLYYLPSISFYESPRQEVAESSGKSEIRNVSQATKIPKKLLKKRLEATVKRIREK